MVCPESTPQSPELLERIPLCPRYLPILPVAHRQVELENQDEPHKVTKGAEKTQYLAKQGCRVEEHPQAEADRVEADQADQANRSTDYWDP